jgi:hypothetical protein
MTSTFVTDLFRDYLSSPESITAGVPSNAALKKRSLSDLKLAAPPRLEIDAVLDPEKKHPLKAVFIITLTITVDLDESARSNAETWMQVIRDRIKEGEDFEFQTLSAWIQANRTEEQRTGWQIMRLRLFEADETIDTEAEMKTFSLSLPLTLTVRRA